MWFKQKNPQLNISAYFTFYTNAKWRKLSQRQGAARICSLRASESSSKHQGLCFPFSLHKPDREDNGFAPQIELTTVLRKQPDHTLKVNKLQDTHALANRKRKKGKKHSDKKGNLFNSMKADF